MKPIWTALALTAVALFSASYVFAQEAPSLTITDAWTTPSLTKNGAVAVYLTVKNTGEKPAAIIGAHSPVAERTELHHTTMDANGVMQMGSVLQAEVPAGGNLYLKSGGLHVMLFGLKQKLEVGETIPVTLEFRRHGAIGTNVEIRSLEQKAQALESHHE